jgi:ubiquinone/menaquinone biosynthesis C-methylase UbiE
MKKTSIVEKHFDVVASNYDHGKKKYDLYYSTLKKLLKSFIPINSVVCEVGCGTGELLVAVKPKKGFGMDISSKMIEIAKVKYSKSRNIKFSTNFPNGKYKYIFMCDVIEHLENPDKTFREIVKLMNKDSIFINTMANPLWEPLLMIWEKLGLKMKEGKHYRMPFPEIEKLLKKSGMKIYKHDFKLLIPVNIPVLTQFLNKHLERPLKRLAFIEYFVAKKI